MDEISGVSRFLGYVCCQRDFFLVPIKIASKRPQDSFSVKKKDQNQFLLKIVFCLFFFITQITDTHVGKKKKKEKKEIVYGIIVENFF